MLVAVYLVCLLMGSWVVGLEYMLEGGEGCYPRSGGFVEYLLWCGSLLVRLVFVDEVVGWVCGYCSLVVGFVDRIAGVG